MKKLTRNYGRILIRWLLPTAILAYAAGILFISAPYHSAVKEYQEKMGIDALALYKNTDNQELCFYGWDFSASSPITGQTASNLTEYYVADSGSLTALEDTSPTEKNSTNAPGLYCYSLNTTETNGDTVTYYVKSATTDVYFAPVTVFTTPGSNAGVTVDHSTAKNVIATGVAQSAAATSITIAASESFAADELIGNIVVINSASSGAGQTRCITDNDASDKLVVDAWTTTPSTDINYTIFPSLGEAECPTSLAAAVDAVWDEDIITAHDTANTAGKVLEDVIDDTGTSGVLVSDGTGAGQIALTSGAVDTVTTVTTVSGLAAGAIDSTAVGTLTGGDFGVGVFASGAITADAIATGAIGNLEIDADAIGASEIAADAIGSSEVAASAIGNSEFAAESEVAFRTAYYFGEVLCTVDYDQGAATATAVICDLTKPYDGGVVTAQDDDYIGQKARLINEGAAPPTYGEDATITDSSWDGANSELTLTLSTKSASSPGFSDAPADGDLILIMIR